MKNNIFRYLVLFCIVFVLSSSATAMSIAINPASLKDFEMVRGGYTEKTVKLSTNDDLVEVHVYFQNSSAEANNWISLVPGDMVFNLSKTDPRNIRIIVEPPTDVPNGVYKSGLIFTIRNLDDFNGKTGAVIDTAVAFKINVVIQDNEVIDCVVHSVSVPDSEKGDDWRAGISILNRGNIRLYPGVTIDVWNMEKSELVRTINYDGSEILPKVTGTYSIEDTTNGLDVGQYFVDIKVPTCDYKSTHTFDVLEPGTFSAEGEILGIRVPAWNNKSDNILIEPIFKNSGEKKISGKFKGVIKLNGEVKKVIDTEGITVKPNEQKAFEIYYSSETPGRYEICGKVYYESKTTFEKCNRFNILDQYSLVTEKRSSGFDLVYVIVGLGVVTLLLLIMIKKKKQKSKAHGHHHKHKF